MTRRDRTTGLPRHRDREQTHSGRKTIAGVSLTDGMARFAILGSVFALLIVVLGLIGYDWYKENYSMPNKTVLTVDGKTYSLRYFTDRLPGFAQANPTLVQGIREPSLLTKIEEEAMAVKLATAAGVDLSDEAITAHIAEDLGTEPGGPGTTYDTLYRQALLRSGLDHDAYREVARASLATTKLHEALETEIGETGEHVTLRAIVVGTEAEAQAALGRITAGEDMGSVAQEVSDDLVSKQEDGLLTPTPVELFPETIVTAVGGKPVDTLVGPIQVNNGWWILRVEKIDPDVTYTETSKSQLADVRLKDQLNEAKLTSEIKRNLSDGDITWAYSNLPSAGS